MKGIVEIVAHEEVRVRKNKSVLFNKRQYVTWKMHNGDMTKNEANKTWKADILNVNVYKEEDTTNDSCFVAVEMPTELSHEVRDSRK